MSSNNTATPSPRKQSIEDLASSVENLKEKLMRLPFAVAANVQEPVNEGEETISSKPPPPPFPKGSLSRSRYTIIQFIVLKILFRKNDVKDSVLYFVYQNEFQIMARFWCSS